MTQEVHDEASASEEVKELKLKIADLRREISLLEDSAARVAAQEDLLGKYANGLFSAGQKAHTSDLLDDSTIGEYVCVLTYCFKLLDTVAIV